MDTNTVPELTVPAFAAKVGKSKRTVNHWIAKGLIEARRSTKDGRRFVIPESELVRLVSARLTAEDRTYAAGAAVGAIAMHGSVGYRKATHALADAGVALARHLRDMELEQPDAEGEHAAEYCKRCHKLTNEVATAVAAGHDYANILQIAAELLRTAGEAAQAADEAHAALGKEPDA